MTRTYTLKRRAEQQARDPAAHRRSRRRAARQRRSGGDHLQHGGRARRRAAAHALCALSRRAQPLTGLLRAVRWSATRCRTPSLARRSRIGASGCGPASRAIYDWYERNADARSPACCATPSIIALTREITEHAIRAVHGGLAGGARREADRQAARDAAARAELLHLADAGARRRPETGRRRRGNGSSHRWRKMRPWSGRRCRACQEETFVTKVETKAV